MDLIRRSQGARSCYFEERFRCKVCRVVVHDFHQRTCGRSDAECSLMKDWYTPSERRVAPSAWRFFGAITILLGMFALVWLRRTIGW